MQTQQVGVLVESTYSTESDKYKEYCEAYNTTELLLANQIDYDAYYQANQESYTEDGYLLVHELLVRALKQNVAEARENGFEEVAISLERDFKCFVKTQSPWKLFDFKTMKEGVMVLAYHADWQWADTCPEGIREGYYLDGIFYSSKWDNDLDDWCSVEGFPTHYMLMPVFQLPTDPDQLDLF